MKPKGVSSFVLLQCPGLGERQCLQRVLSGEYLKVSVPFLVRDCVHLGSKIVA